METSSSSNSSIENTKQQQSNITILSCVDCSAHIPNLISIVHDQQLFLIVECECGSKRKLPFDDYINTLRLSTKRPTQNTKCELCESEIRENNNWLNYCLQCNKRLCIECLAAHNNNSNNKGHYYIDNEFLKRTKCGLHVTEYCYLFCLSCNTKICPQCFNEDHSKHRTERVINWYTSKQNEFSISKLNDEISSIMKKNETAKNTYIDIIDNFIAQLQINKTKVEQEYLNNRTINKQLSEFINTWYANFEATKHFPNYNIINNLDMNCKWNYREFIAPERKNVTIYTNEILKYYQTTFILTFSVNKIYEKVAKIKEYWPKNLIALDNETFISTSLRDVKFWNCKTHQHKYTWSEHTKPITSVIYHTQKKWWITSSYDKAIKVWALPDDKMWSLEKNEYSCIKTLLFHKSEINVIALNNENSLLSLAESGELLVIDLVKFKVTKTIQIEPSVHFMLKVSDQFVATESRTIIKWYTKSFNKPTLLIEHSDDISYMITLKQGILVSGSNDKTIKIWNLKSQCCETTLKGHSSKIIYWYEMLNRHWLSSSEDGNLNIWDINTKRSIRLLNKNNVNITSFIQIDSVFAMSSSEKSIDVWKISSDEINYDNHNHSLDTSNTSISTNNNTVNNGNENDFIWFME